MKTISHGQLIALSQRLRVIRISAMAKVRHEDNQQGILLKSIIDDRCRFQREQ